MDFSPVRQCPTKVSEVMRAQEKHPRADETVSQRLGSAADLQSPEREESTRIQREEEKSIYQIHEELYLPGHEP
ncbi:hypothetical protein F2P81_016644 [Scophthalmus maximus]|uniref:Uncharacterized protein n=1 Tax=Scophthalmus maximus TaxID=52904 RepID=A0A6A4SHV4_SCOMX|nr:hypothetical protein F2P81_016644 [Scophthalmus maximus]